MSLRAGLALTALVFAPSLVFAHAELVDPPPRGICQTGVNNCKQSPCGLRAAGPVTAELIIGTSATIQWRETIDHPGSYELRLSTNGEPTGRFPWVLATNLTDIQGGALPREYGTTFTVPDTANCNPCILQLIQVMTEDPAAPVPYYNCADIRISSVASPATPTPTPTATPAPTPGNPGGSDTVSGTALCSVTSTGGVRLGVAIATLATMFLGVMLVRRRR